MDKMLWKPHHITHTRMGQFMQTLAEKTQLSFSDYATLYTYSIEEPSVFWEAVRVFFDIQFTTQATQILNSYTDMLDAQWFQGATFNFAEQLLRRKDDHPALVSIDE